MPFRISKKYVLLFETKSFKDYRGYFEEVFKKSFFDDKVPQFKQDNISVSKKGVIRGLHFQKKPKAQGKLVYCLKGKILDVAVDIRKGSPNYGKWTGEILSEDNAKIFYIPEGFAHGFCSLEESSLIMYKCTDEYSPEHDSGVKWNDPKIGINWPFNNPIISEKDQKLPGLEEADNNFIYEE